MKLRPHVFSSLTLFFVELNTSVFFLNVFCTFWCSNFSSTFVLYHICFCCQRQRGICNSVLIFFPARPQGMDGDLVTSIEVLPSTEFSESMGTYTCTKQSIHLLPLIQNVLSYNSVYMYVTIKANIDR